MWTFTAGNTNMNRFERMMEHKGHLERLAQARTGINNKKPKKPSFLEKGMIEPGSRMERALQIRNDNHSLYKRMYDLMKKFSPYHPIKNKIKNCPAYELLTYHRLRKNIDIKNTNNKLHNRYVSARPTYNAKKLAKDYKYCVYLENNISQNRNRINPNLDFISYSKFYKNIKDIYSFQNRGNRGFNKSVSQYESRCSTMDNNRLMNNNNDEWFKDNRNVSTVAKFKRPNSCKPNIVVTYDFQDSQMGTEAAFNNTSYKSTFKTKPHSGKTRTNGSASTNVITVTSP